jgi:hypothetical protein
MNPDRSTETRISDWLRDEAPGELPDRVLRATFERTRATRPRRSVPGWRSLPLFRLSPIAIAVGAAAVAILAVGVAVFPRSNQSIGVVPAPSVSPSPSPSPAPSGPGATFGIALDSPASWTVGHDSAEWFFLATPNGEEGFQGLFLFRDPLLPVVDPVCTESADPARPHAVSDFIDFLAQNPGLVSSEPVAVTIGGLSGVSVDVSLPAGTSNDECVTFVIEAGTPPKYFWSVSFGEVQRVAFLDAGQGHVIAVVINARGQIKFNLMTQDVAPILESLTFNDRP